MAAGLGAVDASRGATRVALLGGSFDPVHRGHEALAAAALAQLGIDELWWLPAGQPWQKSRRLTEAAHRVAMLALVTQGQARQRIETCEIDRGGPTYTIDTVEELSRRHPHVQWTLIVGWDQALGLPTWRRWDELRQRVSFAVAPRPIHGRAGASAAAATDVQQSLPEPLAGARATLLHLPLHEQSSTAIRARYAAGLGNSDAARQDVAPEVARYIATHGLYAPTG